jgi:hypothetical protein
VRELLLLSRLSYPGTSSSSEDIASSVGGENWFFRRSCLNSLKVRNFASSVKAVSLPLVRNLLLFPSKLFQLFQYGIFYVSSTLAD